MLYENTFPAFLEAISIGPDPSFLEKNTTFCEFVSAFPQEVELMYDWKKVKRSSNPLNALRNFTKKFTIYGPDLDVQTLKFFVKKVNAFPPYYGDTVKREVEYAFDEVKNIHDIYEPPVFITNNTELHKDKNFLNKLASLLKTCKKPCNYFKPTSASLGTLADFGKALSNSANLLAAAGSEAFHAPLNIGTDIVNQIKPMVRTEFFKLKILSEDLYKDGVKPFFSTEDRQRVISKQEQGLTPDKTFDRLPLTNDTETYLNAAHIHSEVQQKIQERLGDCYRMYDHYKRYNAYDPTMNASYAKRKYMGVKNGNVSSLIDITGSLAPAQFATENTYSNALDVPKDSDYLKYEDAPKAPKYDTYDGPSKGQEQIVTAGNGPINPVEASGSQTDAPSNGKVFEFDFGQVKLTSYGYIQDECPDTGSEMGLGNSNNMIIPLKTVALNPEAYKTYGIKKGDVLIITATDKQGNTFIERRQAGDSSAALGKLGGSKFKMVIDEFLPKKSGSKLAGRTDKLKLKIQIADTKEPLAKWNVQEASQFAPMFLSRNDWERAKKFGSRSTDATQKAIASKMDTEYKAYVKWSEDEQLKPKFINFPGC